MLVRIGAANSPQNVFYGSWTGPSWETVDLHRGRRISTSELMWKPVVKKMPLFEKHPFLVTGIRQLGCLTLGETLWLEESSFCLENP